MTVASFGVMAPKLSSDLSAAAASSGLSLLIQSSSSIGQLDSSTMFKTGVAASLLIAERREPGLTLIRSIVLAGSSASAVELAAGPSAVDPILILTALLEAADGKQILIAQVWAPNTAVDTDAPEAEAT